LGLDKVKQATFWRRLFDFDVPRSIIGHTILNLDTLLTLGSNIMTSRPLLLIVVSVLLGVLGQLLLKMGITQVGSLELEGELAGLVKVGIRVFGNLKVIGGFAAYGISSLFWIAVLSKVNLSLAYPMLALNYVLIPLAAWLFLGEQIPSLRWLGVGIIIIGIIIISRT
jgi:multidrug transporter EmrE-like cation transporter